MMHVISRDEIEPRMDGRILMRDSETGRRREVFVSRHALEMYRERYGSFLANVESFARAHEVRMVRVFTDELLESVIARAAQSGFLERT